MSRSTRKTPIKSICSCRSNKLYKQFEHRRERRLVAMLMLTENWDKLPHPKEYGNEWSSPRDGKCWFGNHHDSVYAWPYIHYWSGKPILSPVEWVILSIIDAYNYKKEMRK